MPTNINVVSDLAQCIYCNSIHKASELIDVGKEKALLSPPANSRIKLKQGMGDNFEIVLAPGGFKFQYLFMFIFSFFWLAFISLWTFLAAQAGIFPVLFSIPFWLVGFSMLNNLLNTVRERQEICLKGDELRIRKKRVFLSKEYNFNIKKMHDIRMNPIKMNPLLFLGNIQFMSSVKRRFRRIPELPTILKGEGNTHFFENANDVEQEWIVGFLQMMRDKRRIGR
ncbi:MAG: hypothetical protein AAGD28_21550 [Bacteroidota bacterium]